MKAIFCSIPAYAENNEVRVGLNYASFSTKEQNQTICDILTEYRQVLAPKFRSAGIAFYKDFTYAEFIHVLEAAQAAARIPAINPSWLGFLKEQHALDEALLSNGLAHSEVRLVRAA